MADVITSTPPSVHLLRLPEVLERMKISRSTWYLGIAAGRYPRGIQLSRRATAWLESDIDDLIARLIADRG